MQTAAEDALAAAGIAGQVLILHPDMHGLVVDRGRVGRPSTTSTPADGHRPKTTAVSSEPTKDLVAVANSHPDRDYQVRCQCPEFTCLCPLTGQPDFATVTLTYVPDRSLVELKSLKLYLWSFREEGGFHEDMTNRILDDLVAAIAPRRMTVTTDWLVRGGIHTVVEASHP